VALYVFDLNDGQLRIMRDVEVVAETTGYALLADHEVLLGEPAQRAARLHPRQANSQFWDRMNVDPLPVAGKNANNHADLVYQQLRVLLSDAAVTAQDDLVVATPGNVTPEQLSLFLGIAQELDVRVTGLVDAAVAAVCTQPAPRRAFHLDIGLHRGTLTTLETDHDTSRQRAEELTELGLLRILDGFVNVIADRFVSETRYDPLRIAVTEQQLFDQVSSWVATPDRATDLAIEVKHEGTQRRVDVGAGRLVEKAAQRYRLLGNHLSAGDVLFLSHRAASLPGLIEQLVAMNVVPKTLTATALAEGIDTHAELIVSDPAQLRFVTKLPSAGTVEAEASEPTAEPTHLLCGNELMVLPTAGPIGISAFEAARAAGLTDDLTLARDEAGLTLAAMSKADLSVNGEPAGTHQRLISGDTVHFNGVEFVLVREIDGT
jgi:hypothetical protein